MKDFIYIVKDMKARVQRDITSLKDDRASIESISSGYGYIIHTYEYLFKLAILTKQDLMLDELLASYYGQEEESEYLSGASPGKEV